MKFYPKSLFISFGLALLMLLMLALPVAAQIKSTAPLALPNAPEACTTLGKSSEIPQASLINFDDLTGNTVIGDRYCLLVSVSKTVGLPRRLFMPMSPLKLPRRRMSPAIMPL